MHVLLVFRIVLRFTKGESYRPFSDISIFFFITKCNLIGGLIEGRIRKIESVQFQIYATELKSNMQYVGIWETDRYFPLYFQ